MLAIIAEKAYSEENENEFRSNMERRLARTWQKTGDLIVPVGKKLGFAGADGSEATFQYDSGVFSLQIDGVTLVSFATDTDLTAITSAYQAADTTLQANITSEATTRANADTAIASSVTTLTATVNGHTSSISINATAIATVDGKLSASYALTVDGGGRIASMKLLSDGTTSSVKFLATTFSVYNGTTDEAPFTVEGGVVKAKKVAADSVTATEINVASLDAISATIGTLRTATSGARVEIKDNLIEVYDASNVLRVQIGVLP